MSWKAAITETSVGSQSAPDLAATAEHRLWIRTTLPHARVNLTWHLGATEVRHNAVLMEISGGGAAVQMAAGPPGDRPVWFHLIHAGKVAEPIEAVLVEERLIEPGKTLCRLRFTSGAALEGVIPLQKERRSWKRFPALETHAELEWQEGGATHCVAVALVNISGGGAAVRADAPPPSDRPFWLSLRVGDFQSTRVLCRLVVFSSDVGEQPIARVEFQEGCPIDLFEMAVNGLK
jgi:hypothetical protein